MDASGTAAANHARLKARQRLSQRLGQKALGQAVTQPGPRIGGGALPARLGGPPATPAWGRAAGAPAAAAAVAPAWGRVAVATGAGVPAGFGAPTRGRGRGRGRGAATAAPFARGALRGGARGAARGRAGRGGGGQLPEAGDISNPSLHVGRVPAEVNTRPILTQHFQQFGSVSAGIAVGLPKDGWAQRKRGCNGHFCSPARLSVAIGVYLRVVDCAALLNLFDVAACRSCPCEITLPRCAQLSPFPPTRRLLLRRIAGRYHPFSPRPHSHTALMCARTHAHART